VTAKLSRKSYLTLVSTITLLLLTITPVYAAPSLGLGSTASYNLTGKIQVSQSCTSDPVLYASQACTGFSAVNLSSANVAILDDSKCSPGGDPACSFSPTFVSVSQGDMVVWTNLGTLQHDVKSNSTANFGLPSFSGNLTGRATVFQVTFLLPGTYQYYDAIYNWMKGTILVTSTPPPPPPPMPTSFQVDLSGTVGWNVEGLSSSEANLNVSHQISVSVSPLPGFSFTPVTESGSFEQSINLSTRVESPSTATGIVQSLSTSLLSSLAESSFATGGPGTIFQNILATRTNTPDYTMWWVNGPLSLGSPVQIFSGWSSVTGSESLNLGGSIGTRSAWIATSQLSQTINLSIPNPSNPFSSTSSTASISLKLLWSYDKSADLLLRNDNAASLTMHSMTPTTIYTATGPVRVTVTRDTALTIDLAMLLSSTNLSLPKSATHTSTLMDILSALPWMPLGLAGLAAGVVVAGIVWFNRRSKNTSLPLSAPTTTPAPSPATPT
jgi:plastocyanin